MTANANKSLNRRTALLFISVCLVIIYISVSRYMCGSLKLWKFQCGLFYILYQILIIPVLLTLTETEELINNERHQIIGFDVVIINTPELYL